MATDTLSAADRTELLDTVNRLTAQLHALLHTTCGESGESFRNFNDEIQDNFMWACACLADDLKNATSKL